MELITNACAVSESGLCASAGMTCTIQFLRAAHGGTPLAINENNDLKRRDGESAYQYHKRLVYGKLDDKSLADYDYAELSKYVYGQEYSTDVARRLMYGSKRTIDIIESENVDRVEDKVVLSDIQQQIIELKKEKQKFFDERMALNKIIRERSRQEELNAILERSIREGSLPKLVYKHKYIEPSGNDLIVALSDIHYGIDIANNWNRYNSDICRDMFNTYLGRILTIADLHHSENCYVVELGDTISGNIHQSLQIANKENVVEQIKGVSELIAEFLAELSSHFKNVVFISVAGNHSRLGKKDDVATTERLDDLIGWYLTARLSDFENILFNVDEKIDNTMSLLNVRGKTYCCVHGDFDDSAQKLASIRTFAGQPVYAVMCGHKHHNMVNDVQGVKVVMSGSFMGMDDYCIKNRLFGKAAQMVCVCNDKGIECYYDVVLKD